MKQWPDIKYWWDHERLKRLAANFLSQTVSAGGHPITAKVIGRDESVANVPIYPKNCDLLPGDYVAFCINHRSGTIGKILKRSNNPVHYILSVMHCDLLNHSRLEIWKATVAHPNSFRIIHREFAIKMWPFEKEKKRKVFVPDTKIVGRI